MNKYTDYDSALNTDAETFTDEHFDSFVSRIKEHNQMISLHDFLVDRVAEHIDQYMSIEEAMEIIKNCKVEETNADLWAGLPPKEAVIAMGFWSYRNDLYDKIVELYRERLAEEVEQQENEIDILLSKLQVLRAKMQEFDENAEPYKVAQQRKDELEIQIGDAETLLNELNQTIENI
jgi:DNA-binding transcriptional MerR regulator